MPVAETTVTTTNARRYLVAVCRHASRMNHRILARHGGGHRGDRPEVRHVEWNDREGTLDLSWGRCLLRAGTGELTVRIEADDDEHLALVEGIIARDLERYGRRESVTVTWARRGSR